MDDQNNLASQLLGDMTYDDPRKQQQPAAPGAVDPRLAGVTVPVLDDMSNAPQPGPAVQHAGGVDPRLAGASVPMLDDMGASAAPQQPQSRYQQLTVEQITILQQQRAAQGLPPYTAEEIADLQAEFIERQRIAAQQAAMAQQAQAQAAAGALLEETTYQAPEKKPAHEALPQVDASALLEEPAPEPERKVVFNQEDLEAAKRAAVKTASSALSSAPQTEADAKRARQQLEALRQQQMADLAQAGFMTSIILTIVGAIASGCMIWFAARPFADGYEPGAFFNIADKFYKYGGIVLVLLAITIVLRVKPLKGLTSFLYGLASVLLLIPGIVVLIQKKDAGGFGLTAALFALAIIGCFAVTFVISTSDKLNAYYDRKEIMYD